MGSTGKVSQVPEGLNQELAITFVIRDWKTILAILRSEATFYRVEPRIVQVIEKELKLAEE